MSKYIHKADLTKIELITSLVGFSKAIMKQVSDGWVYYFENSFEYSKLENVLGRLDHDYNICESSNDRVRRHKLNQVTISCKLFYPGGELIYFFLLARPGINGSMNHVFFKTLKPKSAVLPSQRIKINQYVLLRQNNKNYSFNKNGENIEVAAIQEQWTYGIDNDYIKMIKDDFKKYLKAADIHKLNQIYTSLTKSIAFKRVRKDYYDLRKFMANEINIRLKSDKQFKASMAGKFYDMPESLPELKGIKIPKITVAEQIKPTILKKMKYPELTKNKLIFNKFYENTNQSQRS